MSKFELSKHLFVYHKMPCSHCKQIGHRKDACPILKKPVNQVVQPLLTNTLIATTEFGTIEISDMGAMWSALSKMSYDNFQPFNELIDNAVAAIICAVIKIGKIYIDFDFTNNSGSIEHSGGTTFPHELSKLANCFTFGLKNQTKLNEHGCGLKQSLALLNPTNDKWQIWIKYVDENTLKIISIRAPFAHKLTIHSETVWPGQNKNIEAGSYIVFPVTKDKFSQLYKKEAKMTDINDLHLRIKNQFSHMWMKQDEILSGSIQLIYNGEHVPPFNFTSKEVFDFVESTNKKEFRLSTGALIQIEEIKLKSDARKIPGSNTFKMAMAATGAYLYKNGRFIESINNDGPTRKLYSSIFGINPHNSHNGYIKLINMIGDQDKLPSTVPTKNRFGDSELFDELIDKIRLNISPFPKPDHVSEDRMVTDYIENTQKTYQAAGIVAEFTQEKKFKLSGTVSTPPIDLAISNLTMKRIQIMEFKASTNPKLEHYQQLYFNWLMAKESSEVEGIELTPILVLSPSEGFVIPEQHREYLAVLAKQCGFKAKIQDTKNNILYY